MPLKKALLLVFSLFIVIAGFSQITQVDVDAKNGLTIKTIRTTEKSINPGIPVVSFKVGDQLYFSNQKESFENKFQLEINQPEIKNGGWHAQVVFTNISKDTLILHNVVPFGENQERVYITGLGDHYLSRAHLFRPGFSPVNVILPDNSWELGYSELGLGETKIAALTRRASWENATRRRFETLVFPGGKVTYNI